MPVLAPASSPARPRLAQSVRIYSHSSLFYWWPAWVAGYLMALLTYLGGSPHQIELSGHPRELIHASSNLGVAYFLVLFLVIVFTNLSVRGLASGMVILGGVLVTVVLAYLGWWDEIFSWFGDLSVHLTMGAYFWFSTLLFLTWAGVVFVSDRATYWEVTAGQLTRQSLFGAGSQSYNTQGLVLEKHRDDLFRHWLLGFGSGDLTVHTSGAVRERLEMPNVLFIGAKVEAIQRLVSSIPDAQSTA